MRRCREKPCDYGYRCGGGVTVDGVRYCTPYSIETQIAYKGHPFCADLGEEDDVSQIKMEVEEI